MGLFWDLVQQSQISEQSEWADSLENRVEQLENIIIPPIGMAAWLLTGGRQIDQIEWIINNGFSGISFLQNAMEIDELERKDMAAAITSSQLYVTYHGNVHDKLKASGELDLDFLNKMIRAYLC